VSANYCVEKKGDSDFVCIYSVEIGSAVSLYRVFTKYRYCLRVINFFK
jgi:hypothetical protein